MLKVFVPCEEMVEALPHTRSETMLGLEMAVGSSTSIILSYAHLNGRHWHKARGDPDGGRTRHKHNLKRVPDRTSGDTGRMR